MRPSYTFDELYNQYHHKTLAYLQGLVGSHHAEDLCQEVFNKVNSKLSQFKGEASISTWIYRIATNTAKDRFRSAAYKQESLELGPYEDLSSENHSYLHAAIP